jgi:hypothetical protein
MVLPYEMSRIKTYGQNKKKKPMARIKTYGFRCGNGE